MQPNDIENHRKGTDRKDTKAKLIYLCAFTIMGSFFIASLCVIAAIYFNQDSQTLDSLSLGDFELSTNNPGVTVAVTGFITLVMLVRCVMKTVTNIFNVESSGTTSTKGPCRRATPPQQCQEPPLDREK